MAALEKLVNNKKTCNKNLEGLFTKAGSQCLNGWEVRQVKREANAEYLDTAVRNDPAKRKVFMECESFVKNLFRSMVEGKNIKVYSGDVTFINDDKVVGSYISKYQKQFDIAVSNTGTDREKYYWAFYRLKNSIFVTR
jgi:hypothetical protein